MAASYDGKGFLTALNQKDLPEPSISVLGFVIRNQEDSDSLLFCRTSMRTNGPSSKAKILKRLII